MRLRLLVAIIACAFIAPNVMAQIEHDGKPYSWLNSKKMNQNDVHLVKLPSVDVAALEAEDAFNEQYKIGPWRFGYNHIVNLNPTNSGTWMELDNGDRIWRIAIKSAGALSMNMEFSQYHLAPGAKVFIYNAEKTEFIGSFTHENNKASNSLGTTVVKGDEVIVEFYEPAAVRDQSSLAIGQVTHAYRSIFDYAKGLGDSGNCNNNVVCPVGDNWRDQIRSVAIIIVNGNGACTGTLVNNTCSDGTPYFLSANHCGTNVTNWVFRFNWESSQCNQNLNGPTNQTVSGATLRASNAGSDFALMELSSQPPSNYNVFYSGWDRSGTAPTSQVGIHHPSGDIKKISFDNDAGTAVSWGGAQCWRVNNWEDGTTEPGSSGSGLWDQNGRLVGQLFGGSASCSSITDDNYGRFSVSWNGSSASNRLSDWLDGCSTNAVTDDGWDPNFNPVADDAATQSITNIDQVICGDQISPIITIKNNGTNNLTSVTVDYYLDANPPTTINWTGNLSTNQTDVINVPAMNVTNGAHTFTATTSNPNGNTDGNNTNDTKVVNFTAITPGTTITLDIILDDYGSETTWEIVDAGNNTIASGGPYQDGMDQTLVTEDICIGNGCFDFIINDSYGDGICCGYGNGSYDLNDGGSQTYASGGQFGSQETTNFCITGVGIENSNTLEGINIYPNPSTGLFNINMTNSDVDVINVNVYNTLGKLIKTDHIQGANGRLINYDLSNLANGLYLMEITSGEASFVQKLQINK